jgi:hypothetical protein
MRKKENLLAGHPFCSWFYEQSNKETFLWKQIALQNMNYGLVTHFVMLLVGGSFFWLSVSISGM